jgi:hypothetical protein
MTKCRACIKRYVVLFCLAVSALCAQSNMGELRLKVIDPSGLGAKTTVEISSQGNQYRNTFTTDDAGNLDIERLPFGVYQLKIHEAGFAEVSEAVEIRSALPTEHTIRLSLSAVSTSITVTAGATLIDPYRAGSVSRVGSETIRNRQSSLPGRSLQDLVNSQPGWLYEGNAVLHPRGSEYQTQFVVDGIPLTDNRSPGSGPEISADDVQSMAVYTSGFPAEYGRKLGGVIEINTLEDERPGFHGQAVLSGGSFDTAGAFAKGQGVWGKNTLGFSAGGSGTSHYLNPVVPQNFTNDGTTGDFSVNYERDLTAGDRLSFIVRHSLSRFQVPNELVQQAAGQLQDGNDFETMGTVSYQHTFSPDMVASVRGMVRDNASSLNSNPYSTPVIVFQHNWSREGYFNANIVMHHGVHEWKAGVESDNVFLHENLDYVITDPARFDPGTPPVFSFPDGYPSAGSRPDLEQSAYVQDLIHVGRWTVSAGLRWDHYQLVVNHQAVSPRLSVARYFRSVDLVVHASYDRIFQTPSSENLLLSGSPLVESLNPNVLRLPVEPSHANYYEVGLTKAFSRKFKVSANYYRRLFDNFADDDQIANTAVSFPIAFRKAILYGSEGKIDLPNWRGLSGFVSYSYMVGNVWFPVTGGLFLGDQAASALTDVTGHVPVSQDQRHTLRFRFRYQVAPRLWVAGGSEYGSGLPIAFECLTTNIGTCEEQALAQYGPAVVDRVNFARARVRPNLSVNISLGAEIYKSDRLKMQLQADGQNLNDRLNLLDFAGLFSGNAIAPPRSYSLRLTADF